MIKEKDIVIRVDEELKNSVKKEARKLGISVSSYIRMIILEKINSK